MNTDAPARRARGAALPQRTAGTDGCGKLHDAPRLKGHTLSTRTPQDVPLPIQVERAFGKMRPWMYWPGFAENGQLLAALLDQLTGQIRAVDVQFLQRALLRCQVGCDRVGHVGLGGVGGGDTYGNDQAKSRSTWRL